MSAQVLSRTGVDGHTSLSYDIVSASPSPFVIILLWSTNHASLPPTHHESQTVPFLSCTCHDFSPHEKSCLMDDPPPLAAILAPLLGSLVIALTRSGMGNRPRKSESGR
jgi:hypothetical protein